MKFLPAQLTYLLQDRPAQRNLRLLGGFLFLLLILFITYGILFHILMAAEGQEHSWLSGFYWTLVVMSTLGFGDITFQSDIGRAFSMVVLGSGVLFLLIVLPFTFIQFFYAPWLEAQSSMRAPRQVPEKTEGHVLLTMFDPVTAALAERMRYERRAYYVLEPDLARALEMHDQGISVVLGDRDDMETYRRLRADHAAMVVASGDDYLNTNIAFTVRELTERVPIVSFARAPESVDILELAGSSHVLQLSEMLGRALARRAMGGDVRANVIGRFGELIISEAAVMGTPLVGLTLKESRLREVTGLTVLGLWERGRFEPAGPESVMNATTEIVLAGSERQLARFTELVAIYSAVEAPVLILGGGSVGRAAARALQEREIPFVIVEKDPAQVGEDPSRYVLGSAADLRTLQRAGIDRAPTAMVTTNDDATNIYLTIYCRRLRPDMQIISRATLDRNVSTLHRAGADFVLSYASMGANAVYNLLDQEDIIMLAEGLNLFRHPTPASLVGRPLAQSGVREETGCSVVAVTRGGKMLVNPPPDLPLPGEPGEEMILIGTTEGERRFLSRYGGEMKRAR